MDLRNKELDQLKKAAYLIAGSSFAYACAPFLVSPPPFTSTYYVLLQRSTKFTVFFPRCLNDAAYSKCSMAEYKLLSDFLVVAILVQI